MKTEIKRRVKSHLEYATIALLVLAVCSAPCLANLANFVKVADFPYRSVWGTAEWNGRIYVGLYVDQNVLPIYRSGVNNDNFTHVRNLGSGESIPRLWVSPDGTTLNALTEGHSGATQSPAVHWWTTDPNAQNWSSQTFGSGHTYRYGTAAQVHGNTQYIGVNNPHGPALIMRKVGTGSWQQYGPLVTPTLSMLVMDMQVFNGQLYASGSTMSDYSSNHCGRVVRYNSSTGNWDQVFTPTDGLLAASAVFDGKLWIGSNRGTKIYSTTNGTTWIEEYNFGMTGSWAGVDAMMVYNGKLFAACANHDDQIKIVERPAGGSFTQVFQSNQYKAAGEFVVRGDSLYLGVGKTGGGGALIKYTAPIDTGPPSIPTNVQAVAQSETSIQLTWTASTDDVGVEGYKIFRNGATEPVGTVPGTSTSYTDTGLSPDTTYSYTVSAYDEAGNESDPSEPAFATTLADTEAPSVPTGVTASALSGSEILVEWTASTDNIGVTGYRIFSDGSEVGTTGSDSTSFTHSGLQEATTYSYTVSAYDAAGNESDPSEPAVAATLDVTPPSVPTNVEASVLSHSSVLVTWNASTDNVGVEGYKIYRNGSLVETSDTESYTDTDLMGRTTYSYTVSAYDQAGNESDESTPAAVVTTVAAPGSGQRGFTDGVGVNTIGLLVKVTGEFTYVDESTFLIDDGSGIPITCVVPEGVTLDPSWQYVVVTGISSCAQLGEDLLPLLKVRSAADVMPILP